MNESFLWEVNNGFIYAHVFYAFVCCTGWRIQKLNVDYPDEIRFIRSQC